MSYGKNLYATLNKLIYKQNSWILVCFFDFHIIENSLVSYFIYTSYFFVSISLWRKIQYSNEPILKIEFLISMAIICGLFKSLTGRIFRKAKKEKWQDFLNL